MKKIVSTTIALALIAGAAVYAQSKMNETDNDRQIAKWESLAEQGDTAAMHRLIEFYDENSIQYVEVEEAYDAYGNELPVDDINLSNKNDAEQTKLYSERLNYWLEKGIAINDPVALATKGMRLYYEDESEAIFYLSKAADGEMRKLRFSVGLLA